MMGLDLLEILKVAISVWPCVKFGNLPEYRVLQFAWPIKINQIE